MNLHPVQLPPRRKPAPDPKRTPLTFAYTPSADGVDENLLIFLHGLGDTEKPFARLGAKLNLPQTATMAVRAPDPVPYLEEEGWQWFPSFDVLTGDPLPQTHPSCLQGLLRTRSILADLLAYITTDCGFPSQNIFLFGFSQGGTVALEVALNSSARVGGVVSISGYLLYGQDKNPVTDRSGPQILVTHGNDDKVVPKETAIRKLVELKKVAGLSAVEYVFVEGKGHEMPKSEKEWSDIMKFFAGLLSRRNFEMEEMADVYEVRN